MLLLALLSTSTMAIDVPSDTVSEDYKLIYHISNTYGIHLDKAEEIVIVAKEEAGEAFPTHIDILAVVAIESKFKQYAKNKGSRAKGLMQILYKPSSFAIDKNIADGTDLLKSYNRLLNHNKDAVIQAYNVGIGAYINGSRNKSYLRKFKQAKQQLEKVEV